jgi:hypothetical protein
VLSQISTRIRNSKGSAQADDGCLVCRVGSRQVDNGAGSYRNQDVDAWAGVVAHDCDGWIFDFWSLGRRSC